MLLALISIILSVIMYATFLPSLTRLIGQFTYKAGVERISLDSARLKEDSSLIIVIRNIGEVKCVIDTIYLFDSVNNLIVARAEKFIVNGKEYDKYSLEISFVVEISGSFGIALTKYKVYKIKVVTTNDVESYYTVSLKDN